MQRTQLCLLLLAVLNIYIILFSVQILVCVGEEKWICRWHPWWPGVCCQNSNVLFSHSCRHSTTHRRLSSAKAPKKHSFRGARATLSFFVRLASLNSTPSGLNTLDPPVLNHTSQATISTLTHTLHWFLDSTQ